uniref:Rad60/SUMO-like domain-containing protein n=1 Tax=Plectus sambesii TaxID=2011161 RepID=A0A914XET5_9BILA
MLKESKERVLPLLELDDSNEHVKEAGMEKIKSITIAVKDQESVLVEYCINVNMKMSQLLSKHAEKTGVDVRTIAFLLDHRTVQPEDTPDSLEMKEGDIISAHRLSQSE